MLSHLSAVSLWGLRTPASEEVHVLICGRQTALPRGVRVHRTRQLPPKDVRIMHGLRSASPLVCVALERGPGLHVMRATWLQMEADSYALIARLAQALARPGE